MRKWIIKVQLIFVYRLVLTKTLFYIDSHLLSEYLRVRVVYSSLQSYKQIPSVMYRGIFFFRLTLHIHIWSSGNNEIIKTENVQDYFGNQKFLKKLTTCTKIKSPELTSDCVLRYLDIRNTWLISNTMTEKTQANTYSYVWNAISGKPIDGSGESFFITTGNNGHWEKTKTSLSLLYYVLVLYFLTMHIDQPYLNLT